MYRSYSTFDEALQARPRQARPRKEYRKGSRMPAPTPPTVVPDSPHVPTPRAQDNWRGNIINRTASWPPVVWILPLMAAIAVAVFLTRPPQAASGKEPPFDGVRGNVSIGLHTLYTEKILPLEKASHYSYFHSAPISDAEFYAKPMVLVIGPYSVGKSSFIRSLLGRDFPGQRVGPEPTTDRFVAIMHDGEHEQVIPGHALTRQEDKPFSSLEQFGSNFLKKFEGSALDAPILKKITFVDTPGVLSGEKQRKGRHYNFAQAVSWFAERADMIVVMFDPHKLDISDELEEAIDTLKPHHDKIRILLNKADATKDAQQLMRVFGSLMWSLGKVLKTPEVFKVYVGSFWDGPLHRNTESELFKKEKKELLDELERLPETAAVRSVNELAKRARSVKVHAHIIEHLKKQMPSLVGKGQALEMLIHGMDKEFTACAKRSGLARGDFPEVEGFRQSLREYGDISKIASLDNKLVLNMEEGISTDIPRLMENAGITKPKINATTGEFKAEGGQ